MYTKSVMVLNRILSVLVGLTFLYFCSRVVTFSQSPAQFSFEKSFVFNRQDLDDILSTGKKPYKYYDKDLKVRNIFQFAGESQKKPDQKIFAKKSLNLKVKTPSQEIIFTKGLKLIGIVLDDQPEAIVEDSKKKETLFLRKGDMVGNATVQDIIEGKLIFLYEGRTIELVQ